MSRQKVTTGTSGGGSTELNFDFSYSYTNPSTGVGETIADTTLAANEIRIFAGSRLLGGSTLGQAGPGGGGFAITGFVGAGSTVDAVTNAEMLDQHGRGDGPTMFTLSGNVAGADYSFGVGATIGNLWFDEDTNNDGTADSAALLDANWHFDHTTPVASGKNDFYSVALHETLHALGIGGSESWDALVSGTSFLGAEVIALNGSGTGVINPAGNHFAAGLMSTRLSDGMSQEVVMDPNITTGTRKELTFLDVAALQDIGFSVTAVPEPSSLLALTMLGAGGALRRRRR